MREKGIDGGRYRQWAEPIDFPLDFIIWGVTSGSRKNQMWEANRLALADYRENGGVLGLYHFYEAVNALSQVKIFMECVAEIQPQFVVVDWEDTTAHKLTANDVAVLKDIIRALWQAYPKDKVLVYSNHDDWMVIVDNDPVFANEVELWLAWPQGSPDITDFHWLYKDKMGRPFDEVRLLQYAITDKAIEYGVLNGPTTIDEDVYIHKQSFADWIGTETEPPTEPPEVDMGILENMQEQIDELVALVATQGDKLDTILAKIDGLEVPSDGGTTEPPVEPPAEQVIFDPTAPEAEWPQSVNGLRVAYVTPTQTQLPLFAGEDAIFQDKELRPWSSVDNTASMRINVKQGEPVMVYADGPQYQGVPDQEVRPYKLGGFFGYLVMKEQKLDGVKLWEKVADKLYIPVGKVEIIKK